VPKASPGKGRLCEEFAESLWDPAVATAALEPMRQHPRMRKRQVVPAEAARRSSDRSRQVLVIRSFCGRGPPASPPPAAQWIAAQFSWCEGVARVGSCARCSRWRDLSKADYLETETIALAPPTSPAPAGRTRSARQPHERPRHLWPDWPDRPRALHRSLSQRRARRHGSAHCRDRRGNTASPASIPAESFERAWRLAVPRWSWGIMCPDT
jgi:hypothetical protein